MVSEVAQVWVGTAQPGSLICSPVSCPFEEPKYYRNAFIYKA